jgi:hypothetical protein
VKSSTHTHTHTRHTLAVVVCSRSLECPLCFFIIIYSNNNNPPFFQVSEQKLLARPVISAMRFL